MIEVEIEDEAWTTALPDAERWTLDAAKAALTLVDADPAYALTILLTDDASIQDLNAQFRDKDKPTNVLSFPAAETALPHIGDIALAYGVCAKEAQEQNKTLREHLVHLTTHGVLHLIGYDHETDADAEVMEEMERDVLRGFEISDPYASRDHHVEP
ncbi:MAG: rRNA maturation RNase YbeY [Caulobacteraceae bacterium]